MTTSPRLKPRSTRRNRERIEKPEMNYQINRQMPDVVPVIQESENTQPGNFQINISKTSSSPTDLLILLQILCFFSVF